MAQPPYGYGPYGTPPPARPKRSPFVTLFLALVGALVVVGIAAGGYVAFFRHDSGPDHPKRWDPRVAGIAAFVEEERGLTFDHPVYVDFLTPAEYRFRTAGDGGPSDVSPAQRKAADQSVARYRALGLVTGDVDLLTAQREVSDTGTLAFYSPELGRVIVRGTTMTDGLRVTLAHELTHALQDQHFDIERITRLTGVDDTLLRSVVEGDAVRIENRFVATQLSAQERTAYEEEQQTQADDAKDKLESKVPDAVLISFQVPYVFGPSFVESVFATKGNAGVDTAIRTPPLDLEQIIDPVVYLEGEGPLRVAPPTLPAGVTVLDRGSFGSVEWFLMLAERIDAREALTAIDGWGGDSSATYLQGSRECVAARFRGDTEGDAREMGAALQDWLDAFPSNRASFRRDGDVVSLTTCDPGAAAKTTVTGQSGRALGFPALRAQAIAASLGDGSSIEQARCFGDAIVSKLTLAQVSDETGEFAASAELRTIITEARSACR